MNRWSGWAGGSGAGKQRLKEGLDVEAEVNDLLLKPLQVPQSETQERP